MLRSTIFALMIELFPLPPLERTLIATVCGVEGAPFTPYHLTASGWNNNIADRIATSHDGKGNAGRVVRC